MKTIDDALKYADTFDSPHNQHMSIVMLASEVRRLRDEVNGLTGSLDRAEKALKEAQEQEPVAFWWVGPDGKDNGGPYRGKPSDAAIDNALNMGCEPVLLYARPVPAAPAVAAGLPAIGPYRDFIPAPAEPTVAVPAVPTDEQIHVAYREALGQSIRERDMPEIRKFARALLQSASVPAVAAPAVPDDCVSQDESTMMMAASALVLYRAGESAEYMAKAIEALLQSDEGCSWQLSPTAAPAPTVARSTGCRKSRTAIAVCIRAAAGVKTILLMPVKWLTP